VTIVGHNERVSLAAALAATFAIGLTACGSDNDQALDATGPRVATVTDLQELADSAGHPVYWLGPQAGSQYELTVSEDGHIFVRYLQAGVPIGSEDVETLTVSTYPVNDARDVLSASTEETGASTATAPSDGLVVVYPTDPQSAYLAYPDSDYQAEVFAPKPGAALKIASSGQVEPIH
jgi:hypothetical protein